MSLLDQIYSPLDLKKLKNNQLEELAQELRKEIITTVSQNGGHLAPNLGVVELTLALHRVFDTTVDKLIFDVGHQSYVHKILTGRREKFHSLRKFGGISGFPRRSESNHDAFGTGHSSTSISASLGMAVARDLKKEKYSVVGIIGDGALTGGMSFEALNHAGHLGTDLIVVLNDNEMSIGKNVGGLAKYLTKIRTDPMYSRGKDEVENLLKKLPIGEKVLKVVDRLKDSVKYLVVPGMLFEELGFTYLGPIDGHNINDMIKVLQQARTVKGPILIHMITVKGKGYRPAEETPDKFHGVGPFDIATGQVLKKSAPPTYTAVFSDTLIKLAKADDKILAITAAMTSGTGLSAFAKEFPQRFFDVGIAEQHAVTMAAGLAANGYKPVVALYSTFMQRAFDQALHDVCLQNLPVVFAIDRAGIVGDDGATHQGLFDVSILRVIPNMVIMAPKDENELTHMLKTAVELPGPSVVRYPRGSGLGCPIDENAVALPIGKAEIINEGKDITILAVGNMVALAKQAATRLKLSGVAATVINVRFIKPLDEECICHFAEKSGNLLIVEENMLAGGFGSAVLEVLEERKISHVRVKRIGITDEFVEHGTQAIMREKYGLTKENIVLQALDLLGKKRKLKVALD